MSLVTRSITKPGFYTGVFPLMPNRDWEHAAAGLRRQVRLRGQSRLTVGASPSHSPSHSPSLGPDSGLGADSDHEATRYER
jgi:UDP-3-O-[3-hydroxymyristoyl] glucosamine N-acyltransferase